MENPTSPLRRRRRLALVALVALLALLALLVLLRGGGRIALEQGVEFTGLTAPREATPGGALQLTFTLQPHGPLSSDAWIFVHVESENNAGNSCRVVHDQLPAPSPTRWGEQAVEHNVTLTVPGSCEPGRLHVFAGLYDRQTWRRLKVLEPPTADNRVHAGWIDVVRDAPDGSTRKISPSDTRLRGYLALLRPWTRWGAGIALAAVMATSLFVRRRAEDDDEQAAARAAPLSAMARRAALLAPAIPFVLGILVSLEFVKDDAYISFRYAHNLVTGHGLVFNPGDKLEGITNFLWVFVLAPFEALGWDLFQVCEVLGTILGIFALVKIGRLSAWINGEREELSHVWGAVWVSCSSSFVLWAKSGLEQPLGALLPILGAWILWTARDRKASTPGDEPAALRGLERRHLLAGLVMGAGCMTRPELHLMAILVGLPLVLDAVRARRITRAQAMYVAGILAITVPCHAFRYAYYGTLVPNTFYVKTGTGSTVWREGLRSLHDMFEFNYTGALIVLSPLAFADRKRLAEKATMALISVAFMVYYVKVGVDEMQWHRLYLPALPFTAVLATLGAQNLLDGLLRGAEPRRKLAHAAGWGLVLFAGTTNFRFTHKELNGFDGHGDLAGTFHPDLGKFIVRHERPGALVAFQDMGSTPYHAPDINFLDFIGLVDRTVARARHDHGLHAFVGSDEGDQRPKYDASMREYFWRRNPEWAILTVYIPQGQEQRFARAFEKEPPEDALAEVFNDNPFQFQIYADPGFKERYVHVRTWQRSIGYYLSLWRRRDLWEQTPREVVLEEAPARLAGPRAKLERGLELLGSEVTPETLERHEVFVTTWWKLPGPLEHDITFFTHVTAPGLQIPADHLPGDSMYPADRWRAGEILEDRPLFQLPPFTMKPGTYQVYVGVYRRSTGERLKVLEGPSDGDGRILVGSFTVKPMWPLLHQLIPPTRVQSMRKYPDRIVDPKRSPEN